MTAVVAKIDGARRLEKQLKALPRNLERKAYRQSLGAAASAMREAIRRAAPRDQGLLRKAIKSRVNSRDLTGEIYVTHGVGVKYDAFYWHFVEYGTSRLPANPFLRPAFEDSQDDVVDVYTDKVNAVLRDVGRVL